MQQSYSLFDTFMLVAYRDNTACNDGTTRETQKEMLLCLVIALISLEVTLLLSQMDAAILFSLVLACEFDYAC